MLDAGRKRGSAGTLCLWDILSAPHQCSDIKYSAGGCSRVTQPTHTVRPWTECVFPERPVRELLEIGAEC